jgi:hypothetical protein
MCAYGFDRLGNPALLRVLHRLNASDGSNTAALVACIAEVDARKLYLPVAHPSMYSYCVHVLHMSEDMALKRIRAGRLARRFPAILPALADGRLHLTSVIQLGPQLIKQNAENAEELLAAAAYKAKLELERLLAQRFPRPDLPTRVRPVPASSPAPSNQVVP